MIGDPADPMIPDTTEVHAYYRAALSALAYLERARPTGRRFGADADARWAAVRGGLSPADRVDLLLRDANAEWPGALGARTAFDFGSVAEDDAFGRDWPGLDGVTADRFLRDAATTSPRDVLDTLTSMARAWGRELAPTSSPTVDVRARFVVAGSSAIAHLAAAFAANADARWASQVVVVADAPLARQLAAVVPALLNQQGRAVLVGSAEPLPAAFVGATALVSSDASPAETTRAKSASS